MDKYIFQWSIKLDNGEIFVIHSNDVNDLKLKREEIMLFVHTLKVRQEIDSVPIQDELKPDFEKEMEQIAEGYCSVHKVQMKERIGKDGKKFYSHNRGTYPDLEWCNGQGFK